jgi:putative nucleotidyltransferase with HDIG domain
VIDDLGFTALDRRRDLLNGPMRASERESPRSRRARDAASVGAVMAPTVEAAPGEVRMSEVLAALTYALDLTEGQPPGHVLRSCLLGIRLGEQLGLDQGRRAALFWALLLKDAGCSSNAARIYALLEADDQHVKRALKTVDWPRLSQRARYALRMALPDRGTAVRLRRVAWLARQGDLQGQLVALRCERGAEIAGLLGLPDDTAEAIRALDEHWDGRGRPRGLRGEQIPLLARIMCLAQSVEVFYAAGGRPAAYAMARDRRGRWFDPRVVAALEALLADRAFWRAIDAPPAELEHRVAAQEPPDLVRAATVAEIDRLVAAFAGIIDAKSPYTFQHSERVAALSVRLGSALGLRSRELQRLRRAALLHDIGKLALPNRILDHPGRLARNDLARVHEHPRHTARILGRVPVLSAVAATAAAHHERLDGSGYPDGLRGEVLDRPTRILAVADVFEALSADRPYRPALSRAEALAVVQQQAGTRLCADTAAALGGVLALTA